MSKQRRLALGLGIGLGIGIPALAVVLYVVSVVEQRTFLAAIAAAPGQEAAPGQAKSGAATRAHIETEISEVRTVEVSGLACVVIFCSLCLRTHDSQEDHQTSGRVTLSPEAGSQQ
jgi:hypothetical protein